MHKRASQKSPQMDSYSVTHLCLPFTPRSNMGKGRQVCNRKNKNSGTRGTCDECHPLILSSETLLISLSLSSSVVTGITFPKVTKIKKKETKRKKLYNKFRNT